MLLLCIQMPNNIAYGWKVCILPLTLCNSVMSTTDYVGLPLKASCNAAKTEFFICTIQYMNGTVKHTAVDLTICRGANYTA